MTDNSHYPYAKRFSKAIHIPVTNLIEAFLVEKKFHHAILSEDSFENRKILYRDVYLTVHRIYGKTASRIKGKNNPKDRIVRLFQKELSGRSILDIGCGEGYFLASISRKLEHKRLVGIDVSIPPLARKLPNIEFVTKDIIDFRFADKFDVVFSDNVLEHIAPVDVGKHLTSVNRTLHKGGTFILLMPNRLFGPSDVTRSIDFSYSNRIEAQGTHLNETTYSELIPILVKHGFGNFRTIVPFRKIKHMLYFIRISPSIFVKVEESERVMRALHAIKFRGQCFARFEVVLICKKLL